MFEPYPQILRNVRFSGAARPLEDDGVKAAIRAGDTGAARALAAERLALRPHSPVNRDFLARADALDHAG